MGNLVDFIVKIVYNKNTKKRVKARKEKGIMTKFYGNLCNRLDEGKQFTEEIKVGTGVTEYGYTDRKPYEVVEVIDQKHIKIRVLDHKHVGDGKMDNNWELISNEKNPIATLVKRNNVWYFEKVATIEDLENEDYMRRHWVIMNDFDCDKIRKNGFAKKYNKANISIGMAEYYYDYEF